MWWSSSASRISAYLASLAASRSARSADSDASTSSARPPRSGPATTSTTTASSTSTSSTSTPGSGAAELARHAGRVARRHRPRRPAPGRPDGDETAGEDDQRPEPDPAHERGDDEAEGGRGRLRRVGAREPVERLGERDVALARGEAPGLREHPVALRDAPLEGADVRRDRAPMSRRRPARRPTSLVASPSKKRETGPSVGSEDGKKERSVRSVPTVLPSRETRMTAPRSIFSSRPLLAAFRAPVGRT